MEKLRNRELPMIQVGIGIVLLFIVFMFGHYVKTLGAALPMQLFIGFVMGYVLVRGRFGFAGGVKRLFVRGEGSLSKALLLMIVVILIGYLGIQWKAASGGALPSFLAGAEDAVIPGTQNVLGVNLALAAGAFLFGIGMVISGGCASGTFSDLGEGEGRAFITMIFFIIGTLPGRWVRYRHDQSFLGKLNANVYFPEYVGYIGAFLVSLLFVLITYLLVVKYENYRKEKGTYADPKGDWEEFEKPLDPMTNEISASYKVYHKLFVERWSFTVAGLIFAMAVIFLPAAFGTGWGVTGTFINTITTLINGAGWEFATPSLQASVVDNWLANAMNIRNIGIFAGALISFLLAGRFSIKFNFTLKDGLYYSLGGLLLGFGAMLAGGCNAGALTSGIASFSLSGWVFMIFMTLGGLASLKWFAGKVDTIPNK